MSSNGSCNTGSAGAEPTPYRGRLAPSPTGWLHLGHARTFWTAQERALAHTGQLVLRIEDLDRPRCRPEFIDAIVEDLAWFGLRWQEGPTAGGPFGPYRQSARLDRYADALRALQQRGLVYPCTCSRRDVQRALQAPHAGDEEPLYPGTCRPGPLPAGSNSLAPTRPVNWRFRVPDGRPVAFEDRGQGPCTFVAGKDFGDFIVWRSDGFPAYQLAVVVDDAAMAITEVVRGEDLLMSTARQLLLYEGLGLQPPRFFHCPLLTDADGRRLAKRHHALALRTLRAEGWEPAAIRARWDRPASAGLAHSPADATPATAAAPRPA